ncbi:hypothetical protein EAH89_24235 [Roseomonas nepalensis]|uniref:ABC-type transport auxiliary lipoprotein component domain-containing protein n=1 Tax=Muricoccus nepalensis TaxID=1854500 RepID=A0A502FBY1_9PROT|nr:ABC-type transport auxiliary lipoprotein family protein [Roseomonas nepalensis]TPG46916.1 hypothetical protein EAH89_24235 [Roseomonas nepalensis]
MRRRGLLAVPGMALLGLGGCSVISPAYVEPRRYLLAPVRPAGVARRRGTKTILMRLTRAAPGLDGRGLRSIRADGTEAVEYYAEWTAPPAEAAEAALRRWLVDAGAFAAVLAPGTRGNADLVMESELLALHVDLGRGVAVAAMSAVLMRETSQFGTRVVAQFSVQGTAPVPPDRPLGPDAQAAGMVAALGVALGRLEAELSRLA